MKATGPSLSTSTESFENRLHSIIRALGGNKKAAPIVGVSDEMLYRYAKGLSRPTFDAVAKLAFSAGYSLDWLYSGEGPEKRPEAESLNAGGLDQDALKFCLEALETALQRTGRTLTAQKKADVLAVLYSFALEDKQTGKPPAEQFERMLKVVKLAS